jgi:nucleoid DNA-binding protein
MTKDDLIRELYKNLSEKHTLKDLTVIVDEIFNIMAEKLKKGEEVQLSDFGTFSVADKTIKSVLRKKVVKKK